MSDRENARRGPEIPPEPHVVDPGEVVLADTDGNTGTDAGTGPSAGPEPAVSADGLTLAKPELAPAIIGRDAAESAGLDETAEETQAAAEEAAAAGVLAAGPLPGNAPAVKAAPAGTAPPGGAAGDTVADAAGDPSVSTAAGPAGGPGHPGSSRDSGTAEEAAGVSLHPVLSTGGGAGLLAGTDPAAVGIGPAVPGADHGTGVRTGSSAVSPKDRQKLPAAGIPAAPVSASGGSRWAPAGDPGSAVGPRRARAREQRETKRRPLLPLALGALAVVALLVWGITSVVRGLSGGGSDPQSVQIPTAAGADGVIAENVAPSVLTAGQCLLDFTGISNEVTLVTCTTPHRAQLIASEFYADKAEFPGRDQLGARAKAACDTADINTDAAAGAGRIELLHVTPTEGTWADGDRRVDCFAVVEEGTTLSRSLLNE